MKFGNFNEILAYNEKQRASLPVVTMGEETWTYSQLAIASRKVASLLWGAGIRKGDQVGVLVSNQPMFLACMFGTAHIGAVPVLINAFYGSKEIVQIAKLSRIKLIMVEPVVRGADLLDLMDKAHAAGELPHLETIWAVPARNSECDSHFNVSMAVEKSDLPTAPAVEVEIFPDDIAISIYTSGTTGQSKGVLQTYAGLIENARITAGLMAYSERDVLLPALPLFSSAGVSLTLISLLSGTHMVLIDRNNPEIILDTIEQHRVTILDLVPSGLKLVMKFNEGHGRDLSSLRLIVVGGDTCPPDVGRRVLSSLGCNFAIVYGLTETGPVISITRLEDEEEQKVATVGLPIEGVNVAIRDNDRHDLPPGDVGEVCCQSPYVLPGYFRDEQATSQAKDASGWFMTGDLGYIRADKRLVIVGRKKEMVIIGGHNVFPSEVEAHLIAHAGIKEVAVVGIESDRLGNHLTAFVIPKDVNLTTESVLEYCTPLASFKVPRHVVLANEFPYTGSGKVNKRALIENWTKADARS
jgi:fatty-acyl-CoA synthase